MHSGRHLLRRYPEARRRLGLFTSCGEEPQQVSNPLGALRIRKRGARRCDTTRSDAPVWSCKVTHILSGFCSKRNTIPPLAISENGHLRVFRYRSEVACLILRSFNLHSCPGLLPRLPQDVSLTPCQMHPRPWAADGLPLLRP